MLIGGEVTKLALSVRFKISTWCWMGDNDHDCLRPIITQGNNDHCWDSKEIQLPSSDPDPARTPLGLESELAIFSILVFPGWKALWVYLFDLIVPRPS